MKSLKLFLIGLILMTGAIKLAASGTVAIYAIVEKVVFEPHDSTPERVQFVDAAGRTGRLLPRAECRACGVRRAVLA